MSFKFGYSIVIPTSLGNFKFLGPCLASLNEHTAGTYEIVVVLNGDDQEMSKVLAETHGARVVEVAERVGYSEACNIGIEAAKGQYVTIMNDDILVGPEWNTMMRDTLEKFDSEIPECPPAGIVGPASNAVAGVQQIPQPQGLTPENYLQICEQLAAAKRNWIPASFISGFFMMISRDLINELGGRPFDERLVNGAEDNMLSLQAMVKGYSLAASGNVFVYHYGSKTTDRLPETENNARGVRNLFDFYKYGAELYSDDQKVAACCRVRLLTTDHLEVFKRAVTKNASLADALVVLDDRSDPLLWAVANEWCEDTVRAENIPYVTKSNPRRAELNECRDRQWLLDQARAQVGDVNGWYLSFDADEVFEDKFTRSEMERFINPPHPAIFGYMFSFYTFWDEAETMWRKDGTFGAMAGHRLVRILPGYNMMHTDSGMHMGNIPMCRVTGLGVDTSIRIKHYGFTTQEERQRKYEFYTENDKVKDVEQIGHADYRHLIDQDVVLQQWREDTSLTIGTCMRNEEIACHNWLRNFWAFADEMIVTDTGSEDRTVELLEYWGVEVINFDEATGEKWDPTFAAVSDLGRARNLSLHAAETFWYWQIDPDEMPRSSDQVPHPLAYIRRQLDRTDLDAFQFFFRCLQPDGYHTLSQTPRLVSHPKTRSYFSYVHETLDKDLPKTSRVDYAKLDFVHTGALVDEKVYAEKMKRYFRANLRMVRDYPNEARGWFNASLHFLDSPHPAMRTTGMMFMHQALARNPEYAVAVKEVCVQGFTDLRMQLQNVLSLTPKGHPFYTWAVEAAEVCEKFGVADRAMIRCPGHAEEVLAEPQFVEFQQIVAQHAKQYEGGEIPGGKTAEGIPEAHAGEGPRDRPAGS